MVRGEGRERRIGMRRVERGGEVGKEMGNWVGRGVGRGEGGEGWVICLLKSHMLG